MANKKRVVFSILGTTKDNVGKGSGRWNRWRPNISLCHHNDFAVDELVLLHNLRSQPLADRVAKDIAEISPATRISELKEEINDPWDFAEVYGVFHDICANYVFDEEHTEYFFHITTGTHVAQIVIFLLTESRIFPGKLIQTSPARVEPRAKGKYQIIDLDLARYDVLSTRFEKRAAAGEAFLKSGIKTKNKRFNQMIEQIEKVAIKTKAPILITGPTGAGKSQLASKIFALKKQRHQLGGDLVTVNCATLRGDNAMSALFGHKKGAFTGAVASRDGFLKKADGGLLFLDEIGELGLDEQAMLLHALEEKTFYPVGADSPVRSDFQLIAGTNKLLHSEVAKGKFRDDLLARINLWTYELPGLAQRIEDIPPNIEYELDKYQSTEGERISFNKEAYNAYLKFAQSREAIWSGNFRDLNASITRMATLATSGRINLADVHEEIDRLKSFWQAPEQSKKSQYEQLQSLLAPEVYQQMDRFDKMQLAAVIKVCQESRSMAEAGRRLFDQSRLRKASTNDSARLQKYLGKFGVKWGDL